jgi:hypothetical protein
MCSSDNGTPVGGGGLWVGLQHREAMGKVRDNPIGDERHTGGELTEVATMVA